MKGDGISSLKNSFYPHFYEVNPFHQRSNNLNLIPQVIKNR